MIHVWILSVYHLRPHRGLQGRTPIDVWREGAQASPPQLKANADDIDIEFSNVAESALQHYGIDLNTFCYVSARLLMLRRMLPPGSKVTVKWPSHDVGHVWIWDPLEHEYFKVDNKDSSYVGLTLEQASSAKKAILKNPNYRRTRAEAAEIIRVSSNEAMADQKLKNRKKGARLANKTSKKTNRDPVISAPTATPQRIRSSGFVKPTEGFQMDTISSHGGPTSE